MIIVIVEIIVIIAIVLFAQFRESMVRVIPGVPIVGPHEATRFLSATKSRFPRSWRARRTPTFHSCYSLEKVNYRSGPVLPHA